MTAIDESEQLKIVRVPVDASALEFEPIGKKTLFGPRVWALELSILLREVEEVFGIRWSLVGAMVSNVEPVHKSLELITSLENLSWVPRPWHVSVKHIFNILLPILPIVKHRTLPSWRSWRSKHPLELIVERDLCPCEFFGALLNDIFVEADRDVLSQFFDHRLVSSYLLKVIDQRGLVILLFLEHRTSFYLEVLWGWFGAEMVQADWLWWRIWQSQSLLEYIERVSVFLFSDAFWVFLFWDGFLPLLWCSWWSLKKFYHVSRFPWNLWLHSFFLRKRLLDKIYNLKIWHYLGLWSFFFHRFHRYEILWLWISNSLNIDLITLTRVFWKFGFSLVKLNFHGLRLIKVQKLILLLLLWRITWAGWAFIDLFPLHFFLGWWER